jgi:hypothetical protein
LAIMLVSSAFFISVSVSIWIQLFPTSERRTSLHRNHNPSHRFSTIISCGVSIWSSCIGKSDPVLFYLGTTELPLSWLRSSCSPQCTRRQTCWREYPLVLRGILVCHGTIGFPLHCGFFILERLGMMLDSRSVLSVE